MISRRAMMNDKIVSQSGNTLLLEKCKGSYFNGLTLHGKSSQGSTTGAQLYSTMPTEGKLINGITFGIKDGGLSLKGTAEGAQRNDDYFFKKGIDLSPGTYTISFSGKGNLSEIEVGISGDDKNMLLSSFALYNAPQKLTLSEAKTCYVVAQSRVGKSVDCTIYIMLNEGSTAKPYEPYTSGKPSPSPEYPQEIESAGMDGEIDVEVLGKNLIPFKEIPTSTKNGITITTKSNGIVHFEGTATKAYDSPVISLQGVSLPKGRYRILEPRNDIKLFVVVKKWTGNNIWNYDIAEIEEGDELLYCYFTITDGAAVNADAYVYMQIDNGEILAESDFEPYKPAQKLIIPTPGGLPGIPVSSGGNYTDKDGQQWVCDEIDLAKGERVQWIEEYRFTGAEAWFSWDVNNITEGITGFYWYYGSVIPTNHREILNTHAVFSRNVYGGREEGTMANIASGGDDYLIWSVRNEYLEDVSSKDAAVQSFKKLLGEINAKMLYCLATPIRTPLPPETIVAYKKLHTYSPTTTVINDAGAGMSVGYRKVRG